MKKDHFEEVISGLEGGNVSVLLCYGKKVVGLLKEVQRDHLLLEVNDSLLYISISAIQAITKNSKELQLSTGNRSEKSAVHFHDALFDLHYQWITLNEFSNQPLSGVLCEIIETHITLINYEDVLYIPVTSIHTVQKGNKSDRSSLQPILQTQNTKAETQQITKPEFSNPDLIDKVEDVEDQYNSKEILHEKGKKIIPKIKKEDVKNQTLKLDLESNDLHEKTNKRSPVKLNDEDNISNKEIFKEHRQALNRMAEIPDETESEEAISLIAENQLHVSDKDSREDVVDSKTELIDSSETIKSMIPSEQRRVLNNSSFKELLKMMTEDKQSSTLSEDVYNIENISLESDRLKALTINDDILLPCIDCLRLPPGKVKCEDSIIDIPELQHHNFSGVQEVSVYKKMSPEDQSAFLEKQYYALMKHAAKNSNSTSEFTEEESSPANNKVKGSQSSLNDRTVSMEEQYTALLKHAASMHHHIIYK